ncbi:MAG: hypothetical protein ABF335_11080 [Alphaproteobacteria bacterium]
MIQGYTTITWRWVVGLLIGAMITGGGWLYSGMIDRTQTALDRADIAHAIAQENALSIRGLVEVEKGNHRVRDELVARFRNVADDRTADIEALRALQHETRKELTALDRRLTRIEASLNH